MILSNLLKNPNKMNKINESKDINRGENRLSKIPNLGVKPSSCKGWFNNSHNDAKNPLFFLHLSVTCVPCLTNPLVMMSVSINHIPLINLRKTKWLKRHWLVLSQNIAWWLRFVSCTHLLCSSIKEGVSWARKDKVVHLLSLIFEADCCLKHHYFLPFHVSPPICPKWLPHIIFLGQHSKVWK